MTNNEGKGHEKGKNAIRANRAAPKSTKARHVKIVKGRINLL